MPFTADSFLSCTELFLSLGALVSTAELLQIHHALRDEGLLSWRIHRLAHSSVTALIVKLRLEGLFRYPGVLFVISLRLLAALAVIVFIISHLSVLIPLAVLC